MNAPLYRRGYSFSGFQSNQPQRPLPAQQLDIELDSIARAIAALWARGSGGGGTPGPAFDLPIAARSLKANLLSSPAIPQVVGFDQFKAELGIGSGGGSLPDWNDVQNKPVFGSAAQRNVGASAGTVAAGDDPRITGALQAANNGSDIPNKGLFRDRLGLKGAALLDVGTGPGTVAAGDDARFAQIGDVSGKVDKAAPEMARPPIILMGDARWLDQDNTIHAAWTSALDLTATTDMQPLLQSMLDKLAEKPEGGALVLPASGRIRLDRSLNWRQNKPISVYGLGNEESLQFYAYGGGALNLQSQVAFGASRMRVRLENFSIYSMAAGNIGVQIYEPFNVTAKNMRFIAWNGFTANGTPDAPWYYFDKAWNIRNIRQSVFENVVGLNQHGELARRGGSEAYNDIRGTFFFIRGDSGNACTDLFFDKTRGQGYNTGWDLSSNSKPGIEGVFFTGSQAFGCNFGVVWVNDYTGGDYIPPLLTWLDGHLHVYKSAFVLRNVAQTKISGGTCELHTQFDGISGGSMLSVFELNNVGSFNISDIIMPCEPRSVSPIVCFAGCRNGIISGVNVSASGAPYGVQIVGGTTAINVRDVLASGVTQGPVINASSNGYTDTASCRTY